MSLREPDSALRMQWKVEGIRETARSIAKAKRNFIPISEGIKDAGGVILQGAVPHRAKRNVSSAWLVFR